MIQINKLRYDFRVKGKVPGQYLVLSAFSHSSFVASRGATPAA